MIKILIVDDKEANLYSLDALLQEIKHDEFDFEVMKALSGAEALELAINEENIKLIILDIQMPDMDGFEVAKYLKSSSKTKDIPIVFLTAVFKSEEFIKNGFSLGAVDYFTKPIEKFQLLNKIKLYLNVIIINDQLKERENELKLLNENLEQKVRERTKELDDQTKILDFQAHHDALTGLSNRVLFNDRLRQSIKKAKRNNTNIALFFIDLDYFKEINDSLGHHIGDQLLIIAAQRFQDCIRKEDSLSRLGGDEFTIILENLTDDQDTSLLAEKIITSITEPFNIEENTLYISCSIGISFFPNDGDSVENLLKYADAAMYKAKELGRNDFKFYSEEMTEKARNRVTMVTNLREALDNAEFSVYYQPQINGRNGELIGMEALIRWNHPTLGLVSPAKFIPLAEKTGLIILIDRWVMQTAIKQIAQWYKDGLNPGVLALNLSIKQLQQKDYLPALESICTESNFNYKWLEFEVTENQIMTNPKEAIATLEQISDKGIKIAIDDFGTGYSSLAYLKHLPIDKLKIDKCFVDGLHLKPEDAGIAQAIIALAKSLKLSVIAEGVETIEQRDFLVENGCDNIQGYFYGKPMIADEFERIFLKK